MVGSASGTDVPGWDPQPLSNHPVLVGSIWPSAMRLERSRKAKKSSSPFASFWMTWRDGLCLDPIFLGPFVLFVVYSVAVFFPKDASHQKGIHKKNAQPCFLNLTIARLAPKKGVAKVAPFKLFPTLTAQKKMFTKIVLTKAVEQGDYPEITMDGLNYTEKVTYATWTYLDLKSGPKKLWMGKPE